MNRIIVTSYLSPDLDGVSCSYAYVEFLKQQGKDARAVLFGTPHIEAQWVLEKVGVTIPKTSLSGDEDVVLVDCSDPIGIDQSIAIEKVIEIIDHREITKIELFPNAKAQIELIGAAATLIAEKFYQNNITPSKEAAILLFGGIISNNLNFKSNMTSKRDREMAAWLQKVGEVENTFIHDMLAAKSNLDGKSMKEIILSDLAKRISIGGRKIAIGQLEIIGVEKLYDKRFNEIVQALKEIKEELSADMIYLSGIDLERGDNTYIYTNDQEKKVLQEVLDAKEKGDYLKRDKLILRKETIPLLLDYFKNEQN